MYNIYPKLDRIKQPLILHFQHENRPKKVISTEDSDARQSSDISKTFLSYNES